METMRSFFATGRTLDPGYRIQNLLMLKQAIEKNRTDLEQALRTDLGKCGEEAFLTEYSIVLQEIDLHVRNLKTWSKEQRAKSSLSLFPSKSIIRKEPLGLVLIIAPWNYPFQLLFNPLVGALSAGNCVVLKPSSQTPETARVSKEIIEQCFDSAYVRVLTGDREAIAPMLDFPFDHIFFTGGLEAGRDILVKASQKLIPVTLELGGKSPCIVTGNFDADLAAKRILFGKGINAGQTCVAPDYILVEKGHREALVKGLQKAIRSFYGKKPQESAHYGRIVHEKAFDKLTVMIDTSGGTILHGGERDRNDRFIAPTLIADPSLDSRLMREEIFGPILPILEYETLRDAVRFVNERPKPLALYCFGLPAETSYILDETSSGGACVNDTILHVANHHLPFGGVGASGMGRYHGKYSFDLFTHQRSVIVSSPRFDLKQKYPPYRGFRWLERLL